MSGRKTTLALSVVVPVYNEAKNVEKLIREISQALDGHAYEMIFVNDASTDDTAKTLAALKSDYPALRALGHRENAGQSRSLRSGILAANAPVIATLDGDGQNDPADIPALFAQYSREDAPETLRLVGGRRAKRKDSAAKKRRMIQAAVSKSLAVRLFCVFLILIISTVIFRRLCCAKGLRLSFATLITDKENLACLNIQISGGLWCRWLIYAV